MEPIRFFCQACGARVSVPQEFAGRKGQCPKCQAIMTVPAPPAAAEPAFTIIQKGDPDPAPPPQPSLRATLSLPPRQPAIPPRPEPSPAPPLPQAAAPAPPATAWPEPPPPAAPPPAPAPAPAAPQPIIVQIQQPGGFVPVATHGGSVTYAILGFVVSVLILSFFVCLSGATYAKFTVPFFIGSTALWAACDAARLRAPRYQSMLASHPLAIFFGVLLVWIFAFPLYLSLHWRIPRGMVALKPGQRDAASDPTPAWGVASHLTMAASLLAFFIIFMAA